MRKGTVLLFPPPPVHSNRGGQKQKDRPHALPDKGLEINEHTEGWLSVVFLILIVSLHTPIHKSLPDETD